jgi:hypothetical protein
LGLLGLFILAACDVTRHDPTQHLERPSAFLLAHGEVFSFTYAASAPG